MEHARGKHGESQRLACRVLGQPRGPQSYVPAVRADEDLLTQATIRSFPLLVAHTPSSRLRRYLIQVTNAGTSGRLTRCYRCTCGTNKGVTLMTKSELIARLGARYPTLNGRDAKDAANEIVHAIAQALHEHQRVEVRGFGSFGVVMRRAHVARNPKSGESLSVDDKYVPAFRAGKELRERVAQGKLIEEAARTDAELSSPA